LGGGAGATLVLGLADKRMVSALSRLLERADAPPRNRPWVERIFLIQRDRCRIGEYVAQMLNIETAKFPVSPDTIEQPVRHLLKATAGDDRRMNNEPLEREPMNNEPVERERIDRVRARLEALLKANAAPRCGARSKRTGKPCRAAAMPNGRCKVHGGKSTGPRTPEGLERNRRANWKHGHFSQEAKAERSRVRAAILTPL
jgi:hypothetical protein